MFIYNKYHNWYLSIISKAQSQSRKKLRKDHKDYIYYENHHILPSCIFEEYENLRIHKWNGVLLTPREHFICHWLLTKCIEGEGKHKMLNALTMMSTHKKKRKLTSKQYEICRIAHSQKTVSEETKRKMSYAAKNRTNRCKKLSKEHKQKISNTLKNRVFAEETKRKMAESSKKRIRKSHSEETKNKMSISLKNRVFSSDTKRKMSNAKSRKVINPNGVIYNSLMIAAKENNVQRQTISRWCNQNKFGWSFIDASFP